jgi:hypothetical protein
VERLPRALPDYGKDAWNWCERSAAWPVTMRHRCRRAAQMTGGAANGGGQLPVAAVSSEPPSRLRRRGGDRRGVAAGRLREVGESRDMLSEGRRQSSPSAVLPPPRCSSERRTEARPDGFPTQRDFAADAAARARTRGGPVHARDRRHVREVAPRAASLPRGPSAESAGLPIHPRTPWREVAPDSIGTACSTSGSSVVRSLRLPDLRL